MAARSSPGCIGWLIAGGLLIGLISRCGDGPTTSLDDNASSPFNTAMHPTGAPESDPSRTPQFARETRFVQPLSANCRAGPRVSATAVERLGRNDPVGVLEVERGWSLLDRPSDCWIRNDLLGDDRAVASPVRAFSSGGGSDTGSRSGRSGGSTYYQNCAAARAAGAAPVLRGEPGYARRLDRDGDGVGCE